MPPNLEITPEAWIALLATTMAGGGFWLVWRAGHRRLAVTLGAITGLLFAWAAAPTLAQTAQDVVAQAQRRAAARAGAAQALFDSTKARQDRFIDQAKVLADGAPASLKRGFRDLEDTEFAGGGALASLGQPEPSDGVIYVAVSFSMPPADLRRLGRDAQKAGAILVVRGLVHGSFKETLQAAKQVFDEDSLGGVSIDPNVFRAFDVRTVPAFIAATRPVRPCAKGLECIPAPPPHDRVGGNIPLAAALQLLKAQGEAGAGTAAAASDRLGS
jgi:conjugal transfer pilus assembly protein TrbC